MKRLLTAIVVIMPLLWSTTPITAHASSIFQTRSFKTSLVKGEYVYEEPEESVDNEPIDVAEEIITDLDEIEESETLDEQEPQESDEHTDVSTPTDIEPVIDDDTVELEEPIESGEETYDIPDDIETEEEIDETEVQSTQ